MAFARPPVPPPPSRMTTERFDSFDLLRAAGALLVLVSHSFALTGRPEPAVPGAASFGGLGVAIFFSISGYLIALSLAARSAARRLPGQALAAHLPRAVRRGAAGRVRARPAGQPAPGRRVPAVAGDVACTCATSRLYISLPAARRVRGTAASRASVNGSLWTLPGRVRDVPDRRAGRRAVPRPRLGLAPPCSRCSPCWRSPGSRRRRRRRSSTRWTSATFVMLRHLLLRRRGRSPRSGLERRLTAPLLVAAAARPAGDVVGAARVHRRAVDRAARRRDRARPLRQPRQRLGVGEGRLLLRPVHLRVPGAADAGDAVAEPADPAVHRRGVRRDARARGRRRGTGSSARRWA